MAYSNPFDAAYAKASKNPFFPDEKVATSDLPLWQRNEILDQLGKTTRTTGSKLLGLLSVPGSTVYDVLLGRDLGSGSTGGDVLDEIGLRPDKETLGGWARPIADFAFEAGTDPLNLVSFGAGSAGRAAQAAKAANLFGDAQRVAGRALVDDVARGTRAIDDLGDFGHARSAADSISTNFNNKALDAFTDDDLLSRPLVGKRMAARDTRLRDLVDAAPDQAAAIKGVDDYLSKYGQTYADVADDTLGTDIGLRLPQWMGGEIATQLPGGRTVAAALDRTGQAMRWSGAGRYAHSAFNNDVKGTVREGDQILATSLSRADDGADKVARLANTRLVRELQQAAPQVFDNPLLSSAVRNVIEGTASAAERTLVSGNNLDSFVSRWKSTADDYIRRSREAGIGSGQLQDTYGTQYFPRGFDERIFPGGSPPVTGGKNYSVMTGDQLARSKAYNTPGGTQAINDLSRDAAVTQAATDGDAANHIYQTLNARVRQMNRGLPASQQFPEYSRQHAIKLARDIRRMTPEAIAQGRGLFDSHVVEDMGRYISGRERAIARSKVIYDALGSSANLDHYLDTPTRSNSLNRTLSQLKLRTVDNRNLIGPTAAGVPRGVEGAKVQIVDRINARIAGTGAPPLTVDDLANVSVDAEMVARLNRIADFYAQPEVHSRLLQTLDGITATWKASVLSWPARFARDWFSGMASNLVEVGNLGNLQRGYAATKYALQGQFDRLGPVVSQMPRYAELARRDLQAAINLYRDDLGASGLLRGRRIEDLGGPLNSQTGRGLRDELLPGANPVTTLGYQAGDALTGRMPLGPDAAAYSELYNRGIQGYTDSIREFGRAVTGRRDFTDYISSRDTTDPIFRWANRLGDTTDSINRLAGYNALLLDGVSVEEATRRMMRAQVDYNSLTKFERGYIRRLAPFWAYSSRTGKYVIDKIWENPGGPYTQFILRAPEKLQEMGSQDGDGYVAKQIRENYGINVEPLRSIPLLGDAINAIAPSTPGVESHIGDIDLAGVDLINMFNIKQGLDGSFQPGNSLYNTALDVTSQLLHPAIRSGVEMLTGRNLHTGKTLTEFEPTTQKLARAMGAQPFGTLDTAAKYSNYLLDYVPHAPRALQMANRLMDDERVPDLSARLLQNGINGFSGVKIIPIAEDADRLDKARELQSMLSDSPALRTMEQKFIPEELLPYASPDDILLYRMDRQMRTEARKARARKQGSDVWNPFAV